MRALCTAGVIRPLAFTPCRCRQAAGGVGPGPGDTWLDRANMTRIHNLLDRGAKVNFEGMCRVGEADSRGKERRRGCSALPVLERDRGRKTAVCSAAGWGRD